MAGSQLSYPNRPAPNSTNLFAEFSPSQSTGKNEPGDGLTNSGIAHQIGNTASGIRGDCWGGRRESNPQPSEPQSGALPVELLPPQDLHYSNCKLAASEPAEEDVPVPHFLESVAACVPMQNLHRQYNHRSRQQSKAYIAGDAHSLQLFGRN